MPYLGKGQSCWVLSLVATSGFNTVQMLLCIQLKAATHS